MDAATDTEPHYILWARAFARHIVDELRDPMGSIHAHDWAYALYKENAHLRPEDVAQREWSARQK